MCWLEEEVSLPRGCESQTVTAKACFTLLHHVDYVSFCIGSYSYYNSLPWIKKDMCTPNISIKIQNQAPPTQAPTFPIMQLHLSCLHLLKTHLYWIFYLFQTSKLINTLLYIYKKWKLPSQTTVFRSLWGVQVENRCSAPLISNYGYSLKAPKQSLSFFLPPLSS